MAPEPLSLYRQVLIERQRLYDESIITGKFTPFVYPQDTLPALWLFLGVLFFPRLPARIVRIIRFPVLLVILIHSAWVVANCKSLNFAGGYGIGLTSIWGAIMSMVFLVFHDVGNDYQRLEVRYANKNNAGKGQNNDSAKSTAISNQSAGVELKKRKLYGINGAIPSTPKDVATMDDQTATQPYELVWQHYPSKISHAIDWTIDLLISFRGTNWNYRIPTLPPIDIPLPKDKAHASSSPTEPDSQVPSSNSSASTAVLKSDLRSVHLRGIRDFVIYYLLLDFVKTVMTTDPYFLGISPLTSASPWPLLHDHAYTTRFVRLLISLTGVFATLTFIFSLTPICFTLLLPFFIDPSNFTKAPLLEPSMYPPYWSSANTGFDVLTPLLETGLGGFWGQLWHQMFRYGISAPSKYLITRYKIEKRSNTARALQLLIAFGLTGIIHACAGYTTFSSASSNPISGPFAFFVLQGFGIMAQTLFVKTLKAKMPGVMEKIPTRVKRVLNVVFTLIFLFGTGPLLADDFARCGIWLFEPLPISFFRGLGFGPGGPGDGWWCWGLPGHGLGGSVGLWNGKVREVAWYRKGIAVY